MATITDDCYRKFTSISVGSAGLVTFELYLRGDDVVDDVRHSPLQTELVNFQAFARTINGAQGAAIYESANVPIDLSREPDKLGRVYIRLTLSPAQLRLMNDADEFRFAYLGDDYICEVTVPEYIVQDGVRSYVSQDFSHYTLNRVIGMRAFQRAATTAQLQGTNGFPAAFTTVAVVSIEGAGTVTGVTGRNRILQPSFNIDFTGTDFTNPNLVVVVAIGGAKSGNRLTYNVPIRLLVTPTAPVDIPNFEPTTVSIDSVATEMAGQVTVAYTVNPPLTSRSGGLLELTLSETRPIQRDIGTARTANLLDTSLTRAGIERGKSYKVIVAYKAGNNVNHFSPPYYFTYGETLVEETDVDHLAQQVKAAKIFVTGLPTGAVEFDVIHDIFLSDYVDKIRVEWDPKQSNPAASVTNPRDSSVISIRVAPVRQGPLLNFSFIAETQYGDVTISGVSVRSPVSVLPDDTPEQKENKAIIQVLARSYDSEILSIIQDLPKACQQRIVEMELDRMNEPTNDGHVHDFNRFNRRGSRFKNSQSDLSKTKTQEVIDTVIGDISTTVPDIDVGAPF